MSYLDLNAAIDELAQAGELRAFCDAFLAAKELEELATALYSAKDEPRTLSLD